MMSGPVKDQIVSTVGRRRLLGPFHPAWHGPILARLPQWKGGPSGFGTNAGHGLLHHLSLKACSLNHHGTKRIGRSKAVAR
jgi:hypothetical protein